jgi:ribosomal protein S18 acetylase RimI-like enzyme
MDIVATRPEHLDTLKSWFPDKQSLRQWGGPLFRHPFRDATFLEDMRWREVPAYSLLEEESKLGGFGQYYDREGRCHLARLVIDPAQRGKGLGRYFIRGLMQIGMSDLGTDECSLFVMRSNRDAIRCYASLGFVRAAYPTDDPLYENIDFMIYRHSSA